MSGTSKLQSIEDEMYDLIRGINAEPYNYVWGTVNERDMAKQEWPSAVIYFENETNLDDKNGAWSQSYYEEVTYRIEVRARLYSEYSNPVQEIHKDLYKCLDDLKRLFGNKWNLNGECDTIMYMGSEIVEEPAGDIFIPSKLVSRWLVRYEHDRLDPEITVQ